MAPDNFLHTVYYIRMASFDVETCPTTHMGFLHRSYLVWCNPIPFNPSKANLDFNRGLASTLQAAAFNWSGMMVCRFFLALAEAGYAPGIPYLLSFYYMRNELGLRCGIYFAAAPLATCFAGALAYGITSGHAALENWRLLFLVEGLPSIAIAFVAFYFMPDSPEKARFLNKEEKEAAKARAIRQVGQEGATRVGFINFKEVGLALMDVKNWLTAVISPTFCPRLFHLSMLISG